MVVSDAGRQQRPGMHLKSYTEIKHEKKQREKINDRKYLGEGADKPCQVTNGLKHLVMITFLGG